MIETYQLFLAYFKSAWRFRWIAVAGAWVICLAGWVYVGQMPDIFEANTRVYVDTTSDLRRLLGNQIVNSDVGDQLAFVRENMLGQAQLDSVARQAGLDKDISSPAERERMRFFLSREIRIAGSATEHGRRENMYTISYQHENRDTALLVVETVLNSFVDSLLNAKQSQSDATGQFLREQIADYENRLQNAEEKLAAFNRQNFDRLPDLQGGYFQQLQLERDQKSETEKQLRLAKSRLESIQSQAQGEAPRVFSIDDVEPNSIEGRIFSVESRLNDLLLRFTENHPDVIAARETLVQLNRQREEAYKDSTSGGASSAGVNNPVLQALLIARNEAMAEVATLEADLKDRQLRVAQLRNLLDETPEVEAELAKLNRDYDVINARYQSLLESLEREQLTRQVFLTEQVDFRIVDPPAASLYPVAPRRMILVLLVFVIACGAGAVGAFLLSQLNPVFLDSRQLDERFSYPTIGNVGALSTHQGSWLSYNLTLLATLAALLSALILELAGLGVYNLLNVGT